MVPTNYFAVLASVVSAMFIGFLWYGPLFGKKWIALMGWTPEQVAEGIKKGMGKQYALMALGALIMAFVMSHAIVFAGAYMNATGISAGIQTALWSWLGFVVPVLLGATLWEGRKWGLFVLTSGYYLATLLAMGLILGMWV